MVLHRDVVFGRPWIVMPVYVVEDSDDWLITYIAKGAPFGFPSGSWPTASGNHPWFPRKEWSGHGALMVQRPGDSYAVWHFWSGPDRTFAYWYVNLQEPFRRTPSGYDTQDLELDIVIAPDGQWAFKDWEEVDDRVREGRFSARQAVDIRELGRAIAADISAGRVWWADRWNDWVPDPSWIAPGLPDGWDQPGRDAPAG